MSQQPQNENDRESKRGLKRKSAETENDFLDQSVIELQIPVFPHGIISKTIECGMFKWTLAFFNKAIYNGLGQNKDGRTVADADLPKRKENYKKRRYNKARWKKRLRSLWAKKSRHGYALNTRCKPNPVGKDLENPSLKLGMNVQRWRVVARIKVYWKDGLNKNIHFVKNKSWVFADAEPEHDIKHFPEIAIKNPRTLIIRLRVVRVSKIGLNAFPNIDFSAKANDSSYACLMVKRELIPVPKALLEHHSKYFRAAMKTEGKGTAENPIKIEGDFVPALVKRVLGAMLRVTQTIYCCEMRDMLEFAKQYGVGTVFEQIQRKLIERKCWSLKYAEKINLAFEYGLDGFINESLLRLDSLDKIERRIQNNNLNEEFKAMLERRKQTLKRVIEGEEARKSAFRLKMRKRQFKKRTTKCRSMTNTAKTHKNNTVRLKKIRINGETS